MDERVTQVLSKGGVAVLATDTIYGLLGQALSKDTVERVYQIKGRCPDKPFIILISALSDLEKFKVSPNGYQLGFITEYWPGPVSFILDCQTSTFGYLTRGTGSLAFRLPDSQPLVELIRATGPLIAPSANPEGEKPAKNIVEAREYFGENIDIYCDSGDLPTIMPSTLIKLNKESFEILRQGGKEIKKAR